MHLEVVLETILFQMIPFAVLLLVLNHLVFKPMLVYLEERERRIGGFSEEAKVMSGETDEYKAELEEKIAQGRVAALDIRLGHVRAATEQEQELLTAASAEIELQMAEFRGELEGARQSESDKLREEVRGLSADIASQILGRSVV